VALTAKRDLRLPLSGGKKGGDVVESFLWRSGTLPREKKLEEWARKSSPAGERGRENVPCRTGEGKKQI